MYFYWKNLFSSFQLNIHHVAESCTVKPLYYEQLAVIHKCLGYQSVLIIQFSLYACTVHTWHRFLLLF